MADQPDEKSPPQVTPLAPNKGSHVSAPVGPKSGKVLPDWTIGRDYERFNPTAEK